MSKILVSIVSDQTIPNVIFIKELSSFDYYYFITTEIMEKRGKCESIIKSSHLDNCIYKKITVIEDDIEEIIKRLKNEFEFQDEDEIYINLTCGTKIMSIAVYNFFKDYNSKIFYIPIGKNIYKKIFPISKSIEKEIKYRINLYDYLKAYNIDTESSNKKELTYDYLFTQNIFNKYIETPFDKEIINILREQRGKNNPSIDYDNSKINEFLIRYGLPDKLNKKDINYITGGWFEEYVYYKIKQLLQLTDDNIDLNLRVRRNGIDNELDVIFVFDNKLYVIECKTIIKTKEDHLYNNSLYKLAAIKKDYGLDVQGFIFVLEDVNADLKKRANVYNVITIDKQSLINPDIFNNDFLRFFKK